MALQLSRRRSLTLLCGGVTAALSGCIAAPTAAQAYRPLTEFYGDHPVSYEHEDVRLRALDDVVRRGGTIEFEATNTSDSRVVLGCKNPWTIQTHREGRWRDVVWTSEEYIPLCALLLQPGGSIVEEVTLSEEGLSGPGKEVRTDVDPGRYRFVLLGTVPFLAVDFRVQDGV